MIEDNSEEVKPKVTLDDLNKRGASCLPGLLGIEITDFGPGRMSSRLQVQPDHLAPNGYMHAATAVALADTTCGYGAATNLPEHAIGFTTIELKSNFLGTARSGSIVCEARLVHGGRTTQVWDAEVKDETTQKVLTLFRCTQAILSKR